MQRTNIKSKSGFAIVPALKRQTQQSSFRRAQVVSAARSSSMALQQTIAAARAGLYGSMREIKFFDLTVADSAAGVPEVANIVPAEPTVAFSGLTCLNEVRQGATAYNRIGLTIAVKSISIKFCCKIAGTAPDNSILRWLLIYDRQPNGSFPTIATILSQNISTAPQFNSGLNMANKNRFSMLRDGYVPLVLNVDNEVDQISEYVKGRWTVEYKADSGNIGDIATGAIFLIAFVDTAGHHTAANLIDMYNIQSRIRYYD